MRRSHSRGAPTQISMMPTLCTVYQMSVSVDAPGSCSEQDSLHHSESYDTYVKCLSVSEAIEHGAAKEMKR